MKILVTGGCGTIGTPLVKELRKRDHDVWTIDLAHSHELFHRRVDVGEYRQLREFWPGQKPFDLVYHLAAEFGRHNGDDYYEQCWKTNAIGTRNMLEFQHEYGFKMVFFSSSEIYGDFRGEMHESTPLDYPMFQMNDYAISKWANELQILNMSERHNLQNVRVRLFNTYGPGEYYNEYRSVIARFCYYALHAMPYTVHLGHKRSFSYIDDTVNALANISKAFVSGDIYNIGDSAQYDIEYVSGLIHEECGTGGSLVQYKDKEALTTTEKAINNNEARTRLGYMPSVSLEEGIHNTVEWMRQVYGK